MENDHLEAADRENIAVVAHQLGNLLQVISGGLQFAVQQMHGESFSNSYLAEIEWATTRAATLIQQLAALGCSEMKPTPFMGHTDQYVTVSDEKGSKSHFQKEDNSCSGTVLIADDEPLSADLTAELLREAGYTALTARNGREAIQLFYDHRDAIDLLLLDVEMQPGNGKEAYQAIQKTSPSVPIVMCTGFDPLLAYDGMNTSPGWTLQKPFSRSQLLDIVKRAMTDSSSK